MNKIKETLERILTKHHFNENKHKIKETKTGFNFACPQCGDSNTDSTKKRAWILTDKAEPYFFCHHECGGSSLASFFKHFNEKYEDNGPFDFFSGPIKVKPTYNYDPKQMALSEASRLAVPIRYIIEGFGAQRIDVGHPQWDYLVSRNLQDYKDYFLYWPEKHRLIILNTLEEPSPEKKWNESGEYLEVNPVVIGFQARALGNHSVRYITYTLEKLRAELHLDYRPKPGTEDYVKILSQVFFSTHVNWNDTVLITEGPIDALFLKNSISISGATKKYPKMDENYHCQYIFDNDTTGKQKIREKITDYPNKQVYNWNKLLRDIEATELKDINDVVNWCNINNVPVPKFKDYFI